VALDDGGKYQIELQAFWDDQPDGNIRVLGSIDDGGMQSIFPLSSDFIVSPDGQFVGENGNGNLPKRST
jgi:hypothetical protein